jgi:hypothetical protein
MKLRWISTMSLALVFGSAGFFGFASQSDAKRDRSAAEWRDAYANSDVDPRTVANNPNAGYAQQVGACMAGNGVWVPNGNAPGHCNFPQPSSPDQQTISGSVGDASGYPDHDDSFQLPIQSQGSDSTSGGQAAGPIGMSPAEKAAFDEANWGSGAPVGAGTSAAGSKTYTYDDGSTLTERADGTRTSTEATGGAGAAAGGGGDPYGDSADAEQVTCEGTRETTQTACLTPGTKGMDPGEAVMFTTMTNQMIMMGTQIASAGKNMAQQCRLQADMSKLMATINGAKAFACGKMISRCNEVCNFQAKDAYQKSQIAQSAETKAHFLKLSKSYQAQGRICSTYSSQVYAMGMGAMQHGANIVQNQQCAKEMEAFANMPVPTFSPIALPNPTDCTDPKNQSFACFCSRDANKSSPMCAGFSGGSLAGGGSGATTSGPGNGIGSSVATPFVAQDADGDGVPDDPTALQQKQNASNGGNEFSPGGGSAPGGSGLGGLGGGDDGGMGAHGDPRSMITGTSGGSGSGLGGGFGGGGGGGLGRNNGGSGGGMGGFMDKFNLKRFLPGSNYKSRGIAGMSVKSVDGITGPMGPSIWEKATRQYQEQIQKQNVIVDR